MSQNLSISSRLNRLLVSPRTIRMRWKYRNLQPSIKSMLELHNYSEAMLNFIGATSMDRHLLHNADIGADSVVLDVGAFTGKWSDAIIERYDPIVYAFEPNPRSFEKLTEKASQNPKFKPMEYGLGDQDCQVDFSLKGLGSSMLDEREKNADIKRIKVNIAAIDTAWQELSLGNVDLMKINIEGAEYPLLERMIEKDMLSQVDCYLIQFHEWIDGAHAMRKEIQQALSRTHRQEWNYDFVWEKWVRK